MAARKRARKSTSKRKTTTRGKTARKRSSTASLNSSQLKLKERQKDPWDRIKELSLNSLEIYTIPWGIEVSKRGLKYLPGIGYVGEDNNKSVTDYRADDYSWESFIISQVSGCNSPHYEGMDEDRFILRDDQKEDVSSIERNIMLKLLSFLSLIRLVQARL